MIIIYWNVFDKICIEPAANDTANLIKNITRETDSPGLNTYIIGHGIGAHVAGLVGHITEKVFKIQIELIFALDPVNLESKIYHRITKYDAMHVQILHTTPAPYGSEDSVGDIDFIANHFYQMACVRPIRLKQELFFRCSNKQAFFYFIQSINSVIGFEGSVLRNKVECKVRETNATGEDVLVKMGGEPSNWNLISNFGRYNFIFLIKY